MRVVKMVKGLFSGRIFPVLLAGLVLLGVPASGFCADSLIDFSQIATDITPLLKSAITVAAGVGAMVLAAVVCWRFFKRFLQG